jgi:hypothetical protein
VPDTSTCPVCQRERYYLAQGFDPGEIIVLGKHACGEGHLTVADRRRLARVRGIYAFARRVQGEHPAQKAGGTS